MRVAALPFKVIALPVVLLFAVGCAEQPVGYIYTPDEGQVVDLAYTAVNILSTLYDHTDEAVSFLEDAALTGDPASILPAGWLPAIDTTGGTPQLVYLRNYLDQRFNVMNFDPVEVADPIRDPSSIRYSYYKVGSFQNQITSDFYGDLEENRELVVSYADEGRDLNLVEGWFSISRRVGFEYEVEIAGQGGQNNTFTQEYFVDVTWFVKVERFSIDPDDQSARLVIDGVFPRLDEAGVRREPHVSGVINVDARGHGGGTLYLYGEPAVELRLHGRGYSFRFTFDVLTREE